MVWGFVWGSGIPRSRPGLESAVLALEVSLLRVGEWVSPPPSEGGSEGPCWWTAGRVVWLVFSGRALLCAGRGRLALHPPPGPRIAAEGV